MNAQHWIHHFEKNRHAFDEPDWSSLVFANSPLADDQHQHPHIADLPLPGESA